MSRLTALIADLPRNNHDGCVHARHSPPAFEGVRFYRSEGSLRPREGPKIGRGGTRSRALRTMRDFWLCVQPQARETSRSALPCRLRPKGRNADTQRQKGVVIGRENRLSGGIIAREFADLAAA